MAILGRSFPFKPIQHQALAAASGGVNVSITGVSATSAAGTPTVTGFANVTLTGVAATGSAGTPTVTGFANVNVTGVAATGSAGTITVTAAANAFPTGVSATGSAGTPTVTGFANVNVTGVSATGSAGDVTVGIQGAINVNVTGVEATGSAGTPTVNAASVSGGPGDVSIGAGETVLSDRKAGGGGLSRKRWLEFLAEYQEEKRQKFKSQKAAVAVKQAKAAVLDAIEDRIIPEVMGGLLAQLTAAAEAAPKASEAIELASQVREAVNRLYEDDEDEMIAVLLLS